jgi:hypothetical protein
MVLGWTEYIRAICANRPLSSTPSFTWLWRVQNALIREVAVISLYFGMCAILYHHQMMGLMARPEEKFTFPNARILGV